MTGTRYLLRTEKRSSGNYSDKQFWRGFLLVKKNITGDNMNEFIKIIRKQNKERIGWIVLWILGLFVFVCKDENTGKFPIGNGYTLLGAALILMASMDYLINYLAIYKGDATAKSFFNVPVGGDNSIISIMKVHSFDADRYFNALMIKQLPLQLISVAINTIMIFVEIQKVSDSLLISALILLIPTFVNFLARSIVKHLLTHNEKRKLAVMRALSRGLFNLFKLVAGIAAAIMAVILIMAIISSKLSMDDIPEEEVARVSSGADAYMALALIGTAVFVYLLMDGSYHLLTSIKRHTLALLVGAAAVTGIVMYVYTSNYNNVTIREDRFTVKKSAKTTEYSINDVESFRVYEDDNAVQIELTMKTGAKVKLYNDSMGDTEAWKDKYTSDYDYAARLSERLLSSGVSGKLEETDKLEDIVSTMKKIDREDFRKLRAVFGE